VGISLTGLCDVPPDEWVCGGAETAGEPMYRSRERYEKAYKIGEKQPKE
jgi:hypothetical protein